MRAARGIWDFVVGDDWRTAAGVVVALAVTALVPAWWWILPIAIGILLALSVWRVARRAADG